MENRSNWNFLLYRQKKNYAKTLNYRTYRLTNKLAKNNNGVSSYIDEMGKNVKSQTKMNFFDPIRSISIIKFLATFKLACDTKVSTKEQPCEYYPTTSTRNFVTYSTVECAPRVSLLLLSPQCALLTAGLAIACHHFQSKLLTKEIWDWPRHRENRGRHPTIHAAGQPDAEVVCRWLSWKILQGSGFL